jgi:hypothetical protein
VVTIELVTGAKMSFEPTSNALMIMVYRWLYGEILPPERSHVMVMGREQIAIILWTPKQNALMPSRHTEALLSI